jgi:hypothetical protein
MRNSFGFAIVLVVLFSAVLAATSCGPTPTLPPAATDTVVAVATEVPEPTATSEAAATPALAEEETPTPEPEVVPEEALYLPEIPRISCEELKQLMDSGADLVVVDTRMDISFMSGHLPRAINIPGSAIPPLTEEIIEARYMQLPKDKLIVLYCD